LQLCATTIDCHASLAATGKGGRNDGSVFEYMAGLIVASTDLALVTGDKLLLQAAEM